MKAHLCTFMLLAGHIAFGQPGTIDQSFANNGKAILRYQQPELYIEAALLAAGDKAVVAATAFYDGDPQGVVCRYNSNGTPDAGFGTNGQVRLNFNTNNVDDFVDGMVQQSDGKLLICLTNDTTVRLVRLQTNGTVDASFGSATGRVLPLNNLTVQSVHLRPTGELVLLATISNVPVIIQLTSTGALDTTFGTGGILTIALPLTGDFYFASMLIMPDQQLLLAGSRRNAPGEPYTPVIARLSEDGAPDNSFSTDGWLELPRISGQRYNDGQLAVDAGGRVFLAGTIDDLSNNYIQLTFGHYFVCFTSTGAVDNSFATAGKLVFPASSQLLAGGFSVLPDGKLLLAGGYRNGPDYQFTLMRLLANGQPDNTFDTDGTAYRNISAGVELAFIPMRQSDGNYLVAGYGVFQHQMSLAMARFSSSGTADNTYGTSGMVQTRLGSGAPNDVNNSFETVGVTAGNEAVTCGFFDNGSFASGMLAKYTAAGQLDAGFGLAGVADASFGFGDAFSQLQVMADGKIVAAGSSFDPLSGVSLIVARFMPNGQPDASFGTNGKAILFLGTSFFVELKDMAVMPDGKVSLSAILLELVNFEQTYELIRITTAGLLDTGFDTDGRKPMLFAQTVLSAQADGKLLSAGEFDSGNPSEGTNVYTVRLNANGSADNTFNGGNPIATNFSEEADRPVGIWVAPTTGKVLVAVNSQNSSTVGNASIAVYNTNGTLDNTFSGDGRSSVTFAFQPAALAVSPVGDILLSGVDFSQGSGRFAVARLTAAGVLDAGFGTGGSSFFNLGANTDDDCNDLAVQSDGKVLLAGRFIGITDFAYQAALLRVNGAAASGNAFSFTGNGNWSNAANWSGGQVPPNPLPAGTTVTINHAAAGQCVLDVPISVQPGASITVPNGKTFRAAANITLPAITTQ